MFDVRCSSFKALMGIRRGGAIRPAIETLQKANRSCGRARTATSAVGRGFTGYLLEDWVVVFSFDVGCSMLDVRCSSFKALMGIKRIWIH